jgi:hypothetical protein
MMPLRITTITLLAAAFAMAPAIAQAAAEPGQRTIAIRAAHVPDPAAEIGDPVWAAGLLPHADRFMNLTLREPARMRTRVALLYDDRNLYLKFDCEQLGAPIIATQSTNDVGFGQDDFVGIGIDTSGNGAQVYFFEVTPRGVRYQQASESNHFRPVWRATARIREGGWSAQMTIPLSALKFHAGATTTWRIDVVRSVSARNEHFTWAYDPLMQDAPVGNGWPAFTDARFWPQLTGIRVAGTRAARVPSADLYALGAGGADRQLFVAPDGSIEREAGRNFGLDLSYPLTDTATLVATANPDFSNVEVDQQTIAPQEFSRQLKEYRPFFAQGANFIATNPYPPGQFVSPGDLLFYTPNIGPFDRGVKVEGTAGDQSFGLMSFRGYDSVRNVVFDDAAFGFQHALPDRTFLYWTDGVFAHHSDVADETAELGVAGRNNGSGFVWQADDALEHRTDTATHDDYSANAFVDIHKPNYEINSTYRDVSSGYAPVDGFTATADVRGFSQSIYLSGPSLGTKNIGVQVYGDRYLDDSGAVHQADTYAYVFATLKNGLSIDTLGPATGILRSYDVPANADCSGPTIATTGYSGAPCYRDGVSRRFNLFTAAFGYLEGTSSPLTFSYAQGPFGAAYVHQFTTTASRPLGRRLSLGLEYDGTARRALADGGLDSQWLRRISLGAALGADENVTLSLRAINGLGGYAQPGVNLAAAYHKRFRNGNDLYVNFGTPAANQTLHRLIVKYVLAVGPSRR